MLSKFTNNLIFIKIPNTNYYGFVDTCGGFTFIFRDYQDINYKSISNNINHKLNYRKESQLDSLPAKVILFIGQDYFNKKIAMFDYKNSKFSILQNLPKNINSYNINIVKFKNRFYPVIPVIFENIVQSFILDTGAHRTLNNKSYAISFLDGVIFKKLKYKKESNYDDDGSSAMTVPEINVFDKKLKNIKFLARENNVFINWFSKKIVGVNHIGAIGGNVLKNFSVIIDYANKKIYVK